MTPRAPFAICDAKIYRGDELWGCELAHIPIFLAAPFLKAAATAESARVLLTAKLLAGSVHARPAKAATDYQWSVTPHDLETPDSHAPNLPCLISLDRSDLAGLRGPSPRRLSIGLNAGRADDAVKTAGGAVRAAARDRRQPARIGTQPDIVHAICAWPVSGWRGSRAFAAIGRARLMAVASKILGMVALRAEAPPGRPAA